MEFSKHGFGWRFESSWGKSTILGDITNHEHLKRLEEQLDIQQQPTTNVQSTPLDVEIIEQWNTD